MCVCVCVGKAFWEIVGPKVLGIFSPHRCWHGSVPILKSKRPHERIKGDSFPPYLSETSGIEGACLYI